MEDPMEIDDPRPPARIVDARGHRCPVPTLRLRRALEAVQSGERVLLMADDPMARIDVPFFVSEQAHVLVEIGGDSSLLRALVEKR